MRRPIHQRCFTPSSITEHQSNCGEGVTAEEATPRETFALQSLSATPYKHSRSSTTPSYAQVPFPDNACHELHVTGVHDS